MSTFSQSPPGRRLASYQGAPNRSCNFRGSMNRLPSIRGKRKHGFFKSKFYSSSSSDDFSKNESRSSGAAILCSFRPILQRMRIHPPGMLMYTSMAIISKAGSRFPSYLFPISRTQVVPKSLPSRDAYKTFICKGLFTTHSSNTKRLYEDRPWKRHILSHWWPGIVLISSGSGYQIATRCQVRLALAWH